MATPHARRRRSARPVLRLARAACARRAVGARRAGHRARSAARVRRRRLHHAHDDAGPPASQGRAAAREGGPPLQLPAAAHARDSCCRAWPATRSRRFSAARGAELRPMVSFFVDAVQREDRDVLDALDALVRDRRAAEDGASMTPAAPSPSASPWPRVAVWPRPPAAPSWRRRRAADAAPCRRRPGRAHPGEPAGAGAPGAADAAAAVLGAARAAGVLAVRAGPGRRDDWVRAARWALRPWARSVLCASWRARAWPAVPRRHARAPALARGGDAVARFRDGTAAPGSCTPRSRSWRSWACGARAVRGRPRGRRLHPGRDCRRWPRTSAPTSRRATTSRVLPSPLTPLRGSRPPPGSSARGRPRPKRPPTCTPARRAAASRWRRRSSRWRAWRLAACAPPPAMSALIGGGTLEGRVRRLLESASPGSAAPPGGVSLAVAAVLVAAAVLRCLRQVYHAAEFVVAFGR